MHVEILYIHTNIFRVLLKSLQMTLKYCNKGLGVYSLGLTRVKLCCVASNCAIACSVFRDNQSQNYSCCRRHILVSFTGSFCLLFLTLNCTNNKNCDFVHQKLYSLKRGKTKAIQLAVLLLCCHLTAETLSVTKPVLWFILFGTFAALQKCFCHV